MDFVMRILVAATMTTVLAGRKLEYHCSGNPCNGVMNETANYSDPVPVSEKFSTPLRTAKGLKIDKDYVLITWKPYAHDQDKWDGYLLTIYYPRAVGVCRLVPKNQTFLLVKNVGPSENPYDPHIRVHLDTYPMPTNHGEYSNRYLELKNASSSFDHRCSPARKPGPKSNESITTPSDGPMTTSFPSSPDKASKSALWNAMVALAAASAGVGLGALIFCHLSRKKISQPGMASEPYTDLHQANRSDLSYMVSYFPENDDYTNKVASIVNWFREEAGYPMTMDKMATADICSKGPARWAESQFTKADKILVFLSSGYNALYAHDDEMGLYTTDDERRVWYEMQLLKNMYLSTRSASKIVCVTLDDKIRTETLPPWAAITHRWPKDQDKILMRLNDVSEIAPHQVAVIVNQ